MKPLSSPAFEKPGCLRSETVALEKSSCGMAPVVSLPMSMCGDDRTDRAMAMTEVEVGGLIDMRSRSRKAYERSTTQIRAGEEVSPVVAGAVAAAPGIAPHTAARSQPPVRAGCRRCHARRHRHTRWQCVGRHPPPSISLPSVATQLIRSRNYWR